jgi:hypothetical protein
MCEGEKGQDFFLCTFHLLLPFKITWLGLKGKKGLGFAGKN